MSRLLVADDNGTPQVEIRYDDEGYAHWTCRCGATSEPGRLDQFEDVTQDAGIHVDHTH